MDEEQSSDCAIMIKEVLHKHLSVCEDASAGLKKVA
ncbi:hypothetical protein HaLaN_28347, partial [Haematococcus lacustris]